MFKIASACWLVSLSVVAAEPEKPIAESWDYTPAMKKVAAKFTGKEGAVIHIGDSMTIANPYGTWARSGKGKTPEDEAIIKWMHTNANDKTDGWWLCRTEVVSERAYTSVGGMQSTHLLNGGNRDNMPVAKMLQEFNPCMAMIMVGIYDADGNRPLKDYRDNMASAIDKVLANGTICILSTSAPLHNRLEVTRQYNEALRELAKERGLPLIDFEKEILKRRPDDWNGTLQRKNNIHLTASEAGGSPGAAPTPENLGKSGYLLRGWLSVQKIAEVKRRVLDDAKPSAQGEPGASTKGEPAASAKGEPAVLAAGLSELAKLAREMKPGTWAELKTQGYTVELLKVQNHHILEYTDTAVWDPKTQQVLFVGQGHYSAVKFITYPAANNTWKLMPTPSWWKGDPETGKGPIGHAYNNNAIDTAKGFLYHHQSATRLVHRYDIAKDEWTTLPEIKDAQTGHGTAIVYFPEMRGLIRVLAGNIHFYSEEKNAWTVLHTKVPMGPYHNIAKYDPVRKVVILGAGNGSKELHQLDSKGDLTKLPESPILIRISSTVVSVDPISGDLLVLNMDAKNKFYALDMTKKEWKQLPDAPITNGMAVPIPEHGVTLYCTARPEKVFLYKHGASDK